MSILNVNKINPVGGGSTITIAGIASVTGSISVASSVTAGSIHGNLTGNVTGSGANLTNLPAGNLTGTLPAISGANLTGINITAAAISDQNNTSTGYFDLPVGTTAQRPGSPADGMIRFNSTLSQTEEYRDSGWFAISNKTTVSGGTVTTSGSYTIHTFTSSGTFTVAGQAKTGAVSYTHLTLPTNREV